MWRRALKVRVLSVAVLQNEYATRYTCVYMYFHVVLMGFYYVGDLQIAHQSPAVVTLVSSATSVPLVCIGSQHLESLQTVWMCGDFPVGICSPILYATKPGQYTCTITDEYEYAVKSKEIIVIEGRKTG